MDMYSDMLQPLCSACATQLFEPYIECAECDDISICTQCFSQGVEVSTHKNFHNYAVRKNNFPLFENCNWTAKDEYSLLKYVNEHGYGNWEEISKSLQTHTKLECQEHYKKFYIDNIQYDELPKLEANDNFIESSHYPFLFRECNSDDPPRQLNSAATQQLAGYNPYRSEFEMNFDNHAENILTLQTIEDDEDGDLTHSLQCALVLAYNNKLRERKRRYKILSRHGLIMIRKLYQWLQNFEETLSRQTCERLGVFMQLLTGTQFDAFIESLSMEKELLLYLHRLYDFRRNGLKTLRACHLYQKLKDKKERNSKQYRSYVISTELDWKTLSSETNSTWKDNLMFNPKDNHMKLNQPRKISAPLEIIGLPGYEQLNENEKLLCSAVRLVPENFISFRNLLISENNKNGFLRLLDARRLIKIDVNKTRKIYDYLISEGFINKPS